MVSHSDAVIVPKQDEFQARVVERPQLVHHPNQRNVQGCDDRIFRQRAHCSKGKQCRLARGVDIGVGFVDLVLQHVSIFSVFKVKFEPVLSVRPRPNQLQVGFGACGPGGCGAVRWCGNGAGLGWVGLGWVGEWVIGQKNELTCTVVVGWRLNLHAQRVDAMRATRTDAPMHRWYQTAGRSVPYESV